MLVFVLVFVHAFVDLSKDRRERDAVTVAEVSGKGMNSPRSSVDGPD